MEKKYTMQKRHSTPHTKSDGDGAKPEPDRRSSWYNKKEKKGKWVNN